MSNFDNADNPKILIHAPLENPLKTAYNGRRTSPTPLPPIKSPFGDYTPLEARHFDIIPAYLSQKWHIKVAQNGWFTMVLDTPE